jgi:hypothetical protein
VTDSTDLADLTERFTRLGAPDPAAWARSQINEGIPQLARYLFLRQAWRQVLDEDDREWIDRAIANSRRRPDAPFAGVGAALTRLRTAGASDQDITDVARGMQVELLHAICYLLGDPGSVEPEAAEIAWALVQVGPEGEILDGIGALHESVLETDPTGREMRPRRV